MNAKVRTSTLLLVWCLVASIAGPINCQKEEIYEDYGPDIGSGPDDASLASGKDLTPKDGGGANDKPGPDELALGEEGDNLELEEQDDPNKTKFTDQRFARLFPSRSTRGGGRGLMPKPAYKPKPTLPSFIKSTPPLIKAQIVTTPAPRGGVQQNRRQSGLVSSTRRPSSVSSTTTRPSRNRPSALSSQQSSNSNSPRQLTGRLSTTSAPARAQPSSSSSQLSAAQSAASLAAARRRFGQSGISRFQRNQNNNNNNSQINRNETVSSLNPRGN